MIESGNSIVVGLAENERLAGRQVEIRFGTDGYAKQDFAYPSEGRMPQERGEIALDTLTLKRLGIACELGQQVTMEWRPDVFLEEKRTDTFTLCGFWEGNLSVYASMAWVSEEFALEACTGADREADGQICGMRMMGISFSDTKNIEDKTQKVLDDCGYPPMYMGMILVFLAGYLIIYNVFQISVAADIQFYGKLKTLGMTAKQIRRMILGQGCILSLIGVPAGLVLGYLLGIVLMPVLMSLPDTKTLVRYTVRSLNDGDLLPASGKTCRKGVSDRSTEVYGCGFRYQAQEQEE